MAKKMPLAALVSILLGIGACGCVDRRFVIDSDPKGAVVYDERGLPLGATPVDKQFTYYGTYRFTLVKEGYETLIVEEKVRAPWYQWLGLDFISENILPFTLRDVHRKTYSLQLRQSVPAEGVLFKAGELRERAKNIGVPLAPSLNQAGPAPQLMPPVQP